MTSSERLRSEVRHKINISEDNTEDEDDIKQCDDELICQMSETQHILCSFMILFLVTSCSLMHPRDHQLYEEQELSRSVNTIIVSSYHLTQVLRTLTKMLSIQRLLVTISSYFIAHCSLSYSLCSCHFSLFSYY